MKKLTLHKKKKWEKPVIKEIPLKDTHGGTSTSEEEVFAGTLS